MTDEYLRSLGNDDRVRLRQVNQLGLASWCRYLRQKSAVAFLGDGASSPMHPSKTALVHDLIDAAVEQGMNQAEASTSHALAATSPDVVVEDVRRWLGVHRYTDTLRRLLRPRNPSAASTPVQALVCRLPFKGVVTIATDPGLLAARDAARAVPDPTGFTTWDDELGLDRWRTEEVFDDHELPVLHAHGTHTRPENVVLSTSDYRRAYSGRLSAVLADLLVRQHVVWIGFSFDDPHIAAVLRHVQQGLGRASAPGAAPRHIAVMPWKPGTDQDPATLRRRAEVEYNAELVLYPDGDPHALEQLLRQVEAAAQRDEPVGRPVQLPVQPAASTSPARTDGVTPDPARPSSAADEAGRGGGHGRRGKVLIPVVVVLLEVAVGVLGNHLGSTVTAVTAVFAVAVLLLIVATVLRESEGSWRNRSGLRRLLPTGRLRGAVSASLVAAVVFAAGIAAWGYGSAPATGGTSTSPAPTQLRGTSRPSPTTPTSQPPEPQPPDPSFVPVVDDAAARRHAISLVTPRSGQDVGQCAFVTVTATLPQELTLMTGVRRTDDRGDVHLETLTKSNGTTWSGRQYFGGGDSARGQSFTLYVLLLPASSLPAAIERSVWSGPEQIAGARVVRSVDLPRVSGRGPDGCLG